MNLEKTLLPYQRRYVRDHSRYKIWLASRQIGKSHGLSYEAVDLAASQANDAVLLVSASQRQSQEILHKVRIWTSALKLGVDKSVVSRETSEEVGLKNGSRIISLPANPDTIRGFSGHIFLDEFAFHGDSQAIWRAVFPIATRGFQLRITSTPNGKQNMFYEIWNHGGDHWSRHETPVQLAVEEGLDVDIDVLRAGTPDPTTWAQEYECRFVDANTAWLTFDMIDACEHEDAGFPSKAGSGTFFMGADIARRQDLTVYVVLEAVGDVLWVRDMVTLRNAPFLDQDRIFDQLMKQYHPLRVCMDQSGLGERTVEEAKARHGRYRVEGLLFSGPVKQELATGLRRRFEDKTIRIPIDTALRNDLHSVQRQVTVAGNIRFDAARTEEGHADRFWALALAVHAAGGDAGPLVIRTGLPRINLNAMKGF